MSPSQKFNIVPKDIDGVLMCMNEIMTRMENMEESHKEFKELFAKIEKKVWGLLVTVVIALGAKYGLDLTGVTG